jgi:hypothetical protein
VHLKGFSNYYTFCFRICEDNMDTSLKQTGCDGVNRLQISHFKFVNHHRSYRNLPFIRFLFSLSILQFVVPFHPTPRLSPPLWFCPLHRGNIGCCLSAARPGGGGRGCQLSLCAAVNYSVWNPSTQLCTMFVLCTVCTMFGGSVCQ